MHHRQSVAVLCLAVILAVTIAQADPMPDPTPAFEAMAVAGAAYLNDSSVCPGVIGAAFVYDNLDEFTVIDIRNVADYHAGHIPGAYHSSLATLLDDLATDIPAHRPYVIACYSGQTSNMAKIAMKLLGHEDVYTLLYGMSSWNSSLDVWTYNCADNLADPETENQNGNLIEHAFPVLDGDPATIVNERVAAMLDAGFRGVSYAQIQDNLDDYFIINYFGPADYEGAGTSGVPGHIPGAFQFTPYAGLGMDQMLANIPPDMPVVVYAWVGHHEVQAVAYLNMLGYEAYSLKFGANSLFYSSLTAHKWTAGSTHEFPLETGNPLAAHDVVPSPVVDLANFPNPFNPVTSISYRLTAPARVSLRIYDLSGRLVRELLNGVMQTVGPHAVAWRGMGDDGRSLASGTYVYRLQTDGHAESRAMTLLK